jgi:hypothetical protein
VNIAVSCDVMAGDVSEESSANIFCHDERSSKFVEILVATYVPTMLYSLNYEDIGSKKQTPWPLVRERTIPTERPPLVDKI